MNLNISNWESKCLLYLIVLFSWQRYWGRYIGFIRKGCCIEVNLTLWQLTFALLKRQAAVFGEEHRRHQQKVLQALSQTGLLEPWQRCRCSIFCFFPVSVSVRCMLMMYCMPFESNWSMGSSNILEPHKSLRWESYFQDTFKIREFTSCSYYTRLETASAKMHAMAWHMPRNVWSQSKCWRRLKFLGSDKSSSSCFRDNHWHMKEMRGKVSTVATRSLLISLWWTWCWKPSGHASQGDGRIQS